VFGRCLLGPLVQSAVLRWFKVFELIVLAAFWFSFFSGGVFFTLNLMDFFLFLVGGFSLGKCSLWGTVGCGLFGEPDFEVFFPRKFGRSPCPKVFFFGS